MNHNLIRENSGVPLIIKSQTLRKQLSSGRLISKNGRINLRLTNLSHKSLRFIQDFWTTLVNMRWRWLMVVVFLVNALAYLFFGAFFLLDSWISGDFMDNPNNDKSCLIGMKNLTSFIMLGIETITTTGYGYHYPSEYCRLVYVLLTCSTLVTFFIDGAFASVVYVKLGRPTNHRRIFSHKAVISMRNSKLCFFIRLNDSTGKHWIESEVKLYLIKDYKKIEEVVEELKVEPFGMFFYPVEIVHEIDSLSPLWKVGPEDLLRNNWEIVAMVSGCSMQTGQPSKSQSSYLSKDIFWGSKFAPCVKYDFDRREYLIETHALNQLIANDTPLCDAQQLNQIEEELK